MALVCTCLRLSLLAWGNLEVVLFSEVAKGTVSPLYRGCPLLGGEYIQVSPLYRGHPLIWVSFKLSRGFSISWLLYIGTA